MAKQPNTAEVATLQPKAVSTPITGMKAWEDSETGFEGTSQQDFQIPFLVLLQKLSPMVDENDSAYVQGAKAGMFYDASVGELMQEARIVPCFYKRMMVEWKPREQGGGLVGQHEPGVEESLPRNERGTPITKEGNLIVDTRYFSCLRLDSENQPHQCILAFSSSQIKKAKNWMSRMQSIKAVGEGGRKFTPPMYSHVWKVSPMAESNDKGNWFGYKIELEGPITAADLFNAAKESRQVFSKTEIKPSALLTSGEGSEDKEKASM